MSNNTDPRADLPSVVLESLDALQAAYESWLNFPNPSLFANDQEHAAWVRRTYELNANLRVAAAGLIGSCVGSGLLPPTEDLGK